MKLGGGGGVTAICMHIGYVPRERPPFSALNFRSGAYHFHKLPKYPFRSITILHFFGGFCRSGDHHFQNMYAYWVCAARETPIFSPEFPFRSISFSQITKKSVPEHHHSTFFGGFCRSGDHHFQNVFNLNPFIASHGRLSPNAKCSADTHFHAQNGSSSFRRFAFSRSKRLKFVPEPHIFKLVPEPHIFTLDREPVPEPLPIFNLPRHIPTKICGEYPPGGGGGGGEGTHCKQWLAPPTVLSVSGFRRPCI